MKTRIRATAVLVGLPAMLACCLSASASAAAAESAVSPLPASNYTVRPVCAAPAPGHAGCLALRLVPVTAAARAHTHPLGMTLSAPTKASKAAEVCKPPTAGEGCYGLRPRDLLNAYNLQPPPQLASTQTIAIVDAYNDLGAEADLEAYDNEFGLPPCTESNKCFGKVNQKGEPGNLPFPERETSKVAKEAVCKTRIEPTAGEACKEVEEADGWAGEISLDIEVAHAVCQNCKIVLVEAKSATFPDLEAAEEIAAQPKIEKGIGATEISDSWGGPECSEGLSGLECFSDSSTFNHPGIVITVASGDNGYLDWAAKEPSERGFADYPASSPHVVAVGGTRLLQSHGAWAGETVWNDGGQNTKGEIEGFGAGGSGCSTSLLAPSWQLSVPDWESVGCGVHRAVADISADADPYTGVAIYDSTPERMGGSTPGWITIGGTSLASPIIAATFALAGGAGKNAGGETVKYPAQTLYENLAASPQSLHDVELGSNGECSKPFNEETGISGCSELQEAASCSVKAICLAQKGYDGPSGVGTPNGIVAFQPLTAEARKNFEERKAKEKQAEEQKRKEKIEEEARSKPTGASTTGGQPGTNTTTNGGALTTATVPLTGSVQSPIVPLVSGLALTRTATAALRHLARPKVSRVAFAFTLNVAARVKVTLARLVVVHGRKRWRTLPYSLTLAAAKGRDSAHLSAHGTLAPGRYRLTLAPAHGTARTLTFQVD